MKIPKVDNFFGCCQLETAGLIIGWVHLIFNIIGFLVGVLFFILACFFSCDELNNSSYDESKSENDPFYCSFGRGMLFALGILMIIFASIFFAISYYCIKGTKNRNHLHIKPMMVLMAIVAILSFLEIFSMTAKSSGSGLVKTALYGYLFVVMYSLFSVFKEESERGIAPQYQPPSSDKV